MGAAGAAPIFRMETSWHSGGVVAEIKPEFKRWVDHLKRKVPGQLHVVAYYDDKKRHSIDIFTSQNANGVVAATIGLMDVSQSRKPGIDLFTELLMDVRGGNRYLCNILSTVSFFILKDGWKVAPGVVFEKMVSMYMPRSRMKHVLFMPPYQWDEGMTRVDLVSRTICPLLGVPITDDEMTFVKDRGADALQQRWSETGTDVLDWKRDGKV
jgi:antitoxin YqcF